MKNNNNIKNHFINNDICMSSMILTCYINTKKTKGN